MTRWVGDNEVKNKKQSSRSQLKIKNYFLPLYFNKTVYP